MPLDERLKIIENLRMVDDVITFDDSDGSSRAAIRTLRHMRPNDQIIFANGGDRNKNNIPEMDVDVKGVKFQFGVGGVKKANSSSWILEDWKAPQTRRPWGYYRVLHEVPGVKVKELTVEPGASLSMQRHKERAEFWLVDSGTATVYTINHSTEAQLNGVFNRHDFLHISPNEWHQLVNEQNTPLRIIEIQYGNCCEEDDIVRNELVRWG